MQPGMAFHVRIALSGISKEAARSIVAIGDTVIVTDGADTPNKVLTKGMQRSYAEISYSLDESENEDGKPAAQEEKKERPAAKEPNTGSTRKTEAKKGQSSGDDGSFDDDEASAEEEEGSQEILKAGQTMAF